MAERRRAVDDDDSIRSALNDLLSAHSSSAGLLVPTETLPEISPKRIMSRLVNDLPPPPADRGRPAGATPYGIPENPSQYSPKKGNKTGRCFVRMRMTLPLPFSLAVKTHFSLDK